MNEKGLAGKIATAFIDSKLTPLLMAGFLAIGIYGAYLTPREEEPQINVLTADIFVQFPGADPAEVEQRVAIPLEKVISNIAGVEYIYSSSMPGMVVLTAQFFVGEPVEPSLVKLYNELAKYADRIPTGATKPLIKTRSIDDVPMMTITLHGGDYEDFMLRRLAEEFSLELKTITDVADIRIHGGRKRSLLIQPDPAKLAAYNVGMGELIQAIQKTNQDLQSGTFSNQNEEIRVKTGAFFETAEEILNVVVAVRGASLITLSDVAEIKDGPSEPENYVSFAQADIQKAQSIPQFTPAVTLAISKRSGTDAMRIAEEVLSKTERLKGKLLPRDLNVAVTRNYGETASTKVAELLKHLASAIIAVTIVVALAMGWRGGLVVFASVPITFALTLFVYYMFGYTLNRITLFALVFVTGIVVDDSIIVAENMHRHFKMKKLPFMQAAIASIDEVGNPTILATLTVIASVLPMAFVSGLMGPYMSPMPIGASLAMIFSLIVALMITPWLAFKLLSTEKEKPHQKPYRLEDNLIYKIYRRMMLPLLNSTRARWSFILGIIALLLASMALFPLRWVEVKMLPFDNKNELQIIVDMPEGTTLETTYAAAQELALQLTKISEVNDYQIYAGINAPINFNGLVRHYDLRKASNVADIQVNLVDKNLRTQQSHDIAKRIRPVLQETAQLFGANVKVVEVPPGPPVLATLVAEIYGPNVEGQKQIAKRIKDLLAQKTGVVDIDWTPEAPQKQYDLNVNIQKAAQMGVSVEQINYVIQASLSGVSVSWLRDANNIEPVPLLVQVNESNRSDLERLKEIGLRSQFGDLVALGDLIEVVENILPNTIHRKNQRRVIYVTADVAKEIESPVYAILDLGAALSDLSTPDGVPLTELYASQPFTTENYSMKWDGEWHITLQVFRDLGIAFAVVLGIIYILIVGWFQDFKVPIVMMVAIPLSLVGILLGHWILGAFFTATSMIGMIALAGIMVRNSVLLIDFINIRLGEGADLPTAVIEAGAVRTLPILLTAGTVVIGAIVILFDPIFQGLAIALMGGSIASTALTLLMVPLIYYMTNKHLHPPIEGGNP